MIARMIRRQKQKLTENWPRMAADATEAHIRLHVPSQSESDFDALLARLGRPIVPEAVIHTLKTFKTHNIKVDLPTPRPDIYNTDSVFLQIGTYEAIDLSVGEFQLLEACLHKARQDIESS